MQTTGFLEELAAIRRRTGALLAQVPDDEAFQWQPDEGRAWSVGQCLDHLNHMNRVYFGAIRDALAGAPRARAVVEAPVRSTWIGRKFAESMEPGTRKMRAPKKAVPREVRRRDIVATEFLRGLDEIEAVLVDAATIDLNAPTFASPFMRLSRVRAGTGFRILLAHMRRHLAQAEHAIAQRRA
jgi:hypothetical protein